MCAECRWTSQYTDFKCRVWSAAGRSGAARQWSSSADDLLAHITAVIRPLVGHVLTRNLIQGRAELTHFLRGNTEVYQMTELGACWLPKDLHLISWERNLSSRLNNQWKTMESDVVIVNPLSHFVLPAEYVEMKKFPHLTCLQGIPTWVGLILHLKMIIIQFCCVIL